MLIQQETKKIFCCLLILFLISPDLLYAKPQVEAKIGIIAPLTGKGAVWGTSAQQGIELAYEDLKVRYPNLKIDFVYQDVPFDKPGKAPVAYMQLAEVEKVHAIIGPMGSTVTLSVIPLIERLQLPTIVHTTSALAVTKNNDSVLRLWPTAISYAEILINEFKKRQIKKVAAITTQSDNTIDLLELLTEESEKHDFEIVFSESVLPEEQDFKTLILKAKQTNPDVFFINLYEGQIGRAAKQIREFNWNIPLCTNAVMSTVELDIASEELEGVWFPSFQGYNKKGKQKFVKRFTEEPGNPESASAAHDALIALVSGIAEVGTDPKKLNEYFTPQKKFQGITGEFSFLPSGNANVEIGLMQVTSGKIISTLY